MAFIHCKINKPINILSSNILISCLLMSLCVDLKLVQRIGTKCIKTTTTTKKTKQIHIALLVEHSPMARWVLVLSPTNAWLQVCGRDWLSCHANRLAGITPEVNLRKCVTCISLPSANKAAHSGFETHRRHHQKSKTVAPQKGLVFYKKLFFKKLQKSLANIQTFL